MIFWFLSICKHLSANEDILPCQCKGISSGFETKEIFISLVSAEKGGRMESILNKYQEVCKAKE